MELAPRKPNTEALSIFTGQLPIAKNADRTWTLSYDIHKDFDETQLPDDDTLQIAIRAGSIQGEGS